MRSAGQMQYVNCVLCRTIADAHGIVHCHQRLFPTLADRKSRKAWVTDFGLAKILETDASLTAAGDIVGASDS
ncbi:MAG: hypothetical protein GY758_33410 [Fuerstiella sp.]|nr:hypothetical protein [Fuerstiella sp.]MCP4506937.1 hypothetical protein [Fuerstiella sp.]